MLEEFPILWRRAFVSFAQSTNRVGHIRPGAVREVVDGTHLLEVFTLSSQVRFLGQGEVKLVGPRRIGWLEVLVAELLDDFLGVYILGEPNFVRGFVTVNRKA